jgi:hypothetical protein
MKLHEFCCVPADREAGRETRRRRPVADIEIQLQLAIGSGSYLTGSVTFKSARFVA